MSSTGNLAKAQLILSRKELLDFAAGGSTDDYKAIVADWVRVKPANFPRWEPQDPVVAVFQILRRNERSSGGDYLESIVYEALVKCHRQLNTLRGVYRGEKRHAKQAADAARSIGDPEVDPDPTLDLSNLTESEKEHIRRWP